MTGQEGQRNWGKAWGRREKKEKKGVGTLNFLRLRKLRCIPLRDISWQRHSSPCLLLRVQFITTKVFHCIELPKHTLHNSIVKGSLECHCLCRILDTWRSSTEESSPLATLELISTA